MRILYIDIDSLRPSHLGCYGYPRGTSPNIDRLASEGCVLERVYATDTPCLPSRTAFFGGRFGASSGVVNHGGVCADLPSEGKGRDFQTKALHRSLGHLLSRAGVWAASISPFPRRHSAYQMAFGFHETIDPGKAGLENADEIFLHVEDWLARRGGRDNWFLHVNMWDPHTPYDTPAEFGNPFAEVPMDPWITEEIVAKHRASYGPHSAREVSGWSETLNRSFWPWGVGEVTSVEDAKILIDGYDTGVAYADLYVGKMIEILSEMGILDETMVIVSADHGENLGELNIWGDHQTADEFTNHIPCIVRYPKGCQAGSRAPGLFYHLDLARTILDFGGAKIESHDGQSLRQTLADGSGGRPYLTLSQGAWSLQRSLRWENYILIHTLDTGFKDFSEWMLFDLRTDPHETTNLAADFPDLVREKAVLLSSEFEALSARCPLGDPFEIVAQEGGPYHARYQSFEWDLYLPQLRHTGRSDAAGWLEANRGRPRPSGIAAY